MVDERNIDRRTVPVRPLCSMCKRRITIDTDADNDLWQEVIGPCFGPGYVCADCFTREADERMIDWAGRLRFVPYSMSDQVKIQQSNAQFTSNRVSDRNKEDMLTEPEKGIVHALNTVERCK